MKKIIISTILVAASLSLLAQNDNVYTAASTGNYKAYNVPDKIRINFQTSYPAVTNATWEPMNQGWRASYNSNNRLIYVYYSGTGASYTVALPAIHNQVPEDVITKAINLYGNSFYDITMMKSASNMNVYHVRLAENGKV